MVHKVQHQEQSVTITLLSLLLPIVVVIPRIFPIDAESLDREVHLADMGSVE